MAGAISSVRLSRQGNVRMGLLAGVAGTEGDTEDRTAVWQRN